jgi:hypothetical protein
VRVKVAAPSRDRGRSVELLNASIGPETSEKCEGDWEWAKKVEIK